jgi:hypothetical protein
VETRRGIEHGMSVLTSDDHGLGRVKAVEEASGYFRVDCRLAPDLYVPLDAIQAVGNGVVRLHVNKQQAMNMGWEGRPAT